MSDPTNTRSKRQPLPVRWSPRPIRTAARRLAGPALAVARVLLIAVAIAGTLTHALLFWPESVLLVLVLLVGGAGLARLGSEQVAR